MGLKQELIGKELNGFQLTECIGEGGMAFVFKAENCLPSSSPAEDTSTPCASR